MKTPALIGALLLLSASTQGVAAQDTLVPLTPIAGRDTADRIFSPYGDHWLIGRSVGMPGSGREAVPVLLTVGMSMTRLTPGSVGVDLSIGTLPVFAVFGLAVVGVRADMVYPIPFGDQVTLLPGAGVSAIGAATGEGAGATFGFNTGVSAIVPMGSFAFRAGTTFHYFPGTSQPVWLMEFGILK